MIGATVTGAVTGTAVHGYVVERHALRLTSTDLHIDRLPPAFAGLRVGFITDLHHSRFVSADAVRKAAALVMRERPSLIVLGGDYVTNKDPRYAGGCAEALQPLAAPLGVFAVLGNHDDERHVPSELRRRGVEVIRDGWTALALRGDHLALAGVDFWTRRPSEVARALRGMRGPSLLAAHDPRRINEAASLGVGGILAGHTHGGQVVVPGLGPIAARKFPVAAGRLRRGPTEMFVSRGVGTVVVPIRLNCPPEVAILTLRPVEVPS